MEVRDTQIIKLKITYCLRLGSLSLFLFLGGSGVLLVPWLGVEALVRLRGIALGRLGGKARARLGGGVLVRIEGKN